MEFLVLYIYLLEILTIDWKKIDFDRSSIIKYLTLDNSQKLKMSSQMPATFLSKNLIVAGKERRDNIDPLSALRSQRRIAPTWDGWRQLAKQKADNIEALFQMLLLTYARRPLYEPAFITKLTDKRQKGKHTRTRARSSTSWNTVHFKITTDKYAY